MGTPATGLLSTYLRHLCQGHTLSLLRAGQQVWRRRWRWQAEPLAGGHCLPEQSTIYCECVARNSLYALAINLCLSLSTFRPISATIKRSPISYSSAHAVCLQAVSWRIVVHRFTSILNEFLFVHLPGAAGQSSENKNINIWDTLLPHKKSCVSGKWSFY